jgi:hypothetical protein
MEVKEDEDRRRVGEGKKAVKGGGRVWRDKRECEQREAKLTRNNWGPEPDRNKWRGGSGSGPRWWRMEEEAGSEVERGAERGKKKRNWLEEGAIGA